MTRKRFFPLALMFFVFITAVPAYAGGHHGGKRHSIGKTGTPAVTWHKGTDHYQGHYSNRCGEFDHAWHGGSNEYKGHYSYSCADYGHIIRKGRN